MTVRSSLAKMHASKNAKFPFSPAYRPHRNANAHRLHKDVLIHFRAPKSHKTYVNQLRPMIRVLVVANYTLSNNQNTFGTFPTDNAATNLWSSDFTMYNIALSPKRFWQCLGLAITLIFAGRSTLACFSSMKFEREVYAITCSDVTLHDHVAPSAVCQAAVKIQRQNMF